MDVPEITDDMTNSLKTDVGSLLCSFIRVFRSLKKTGQHLRRRYREDVEGEGGKRYGFLRTRTVRNAEPEYMKQLKPGKMEFGAAERGLR
jgi:hypothetical protein